MKKIVLLVLILTAILSAVERMVLGELFTSTTCPPCVTGNAILNGIVSSSGKYLAVVRYHMYWPSPGNDPFYHNNKTDNNNRRGFYGVNSVPQLVVDGTVQGDSDTWATTIDDRHDLASPLAMKAYRTFTSSAYLASQGTGKTLVAITNEGDSSYTLKLYGALTESDVDYTGTNGDPTHHQVMLDMLPYAFGSDVTLEPGKTLFEVFDYAANDSIDILDFTLEPTGEQHIVDASNCDLVFWCQNFSTKEVIQAAKVTVPNPKAVTVSEVTLADSTGDGKLSAGEKASVHLKVTNGTSSSLKNVKVYVEADNAKITAVFNVALITDIPASGSVTLSGDELLLEAASDYDGSSFKITCYAGTDDGSLSSVGEAQIGVAENPVEEILPVLPSIAKSGSILKLAPFSIRGDLSADLFDASGRFVAGLYRGSASEFSQLSLPHVTSGVYFIRLESEGTAKTNKMILLD